MKKILLPLLMLLVAGCSYQPTPSLEATTQADVEPIVTQEIQAETPATDLIEVTGGYNYYLAEAATNSGYEKTTLNRVCFEPAQLEVVNNGNTFCFSNTAEALKLLNISDVDSSCPKYWGTATAKIKNLSDKNLSNLKSDPCTESGTCEFNEAELVEVTDVFQDAAPRCSN